MNDMSSFVDALGDELRARRLPFDAIPVVDMSLMQSGLGKAEMARYQAAYPHLSDLAG